MNLNELEKQGGFVDPEPVKKQIEWVKQDENGEVKPLRFYVHILRRSYHIVHSVFSADQSDRMALYISESVRFGDKADEVMPVEKAKQLDSVLATALINAINEVNGVGVSAKKKSSQKKKSGMS